MFRAGGGDQGNVVRAITIDDIMGQFGMTAIDILKIDIEGAEKDVFEGDVDSWLPQNRNAGG